MFSLYFYRVISLCWALGILLFRKIKDDDYQNSQIAQRFLRYNNQFTLRRLKHKSLHNQQILILLPHCLQNYDCPFKITSFIENCKQCGKCDISTLVALKEQYPIHINVATGGTLARKYIRDRRPKLVIAVACERDLISGIIDSFPLPVYGIFNERPNGPCFNTSVPTDEIEQLLSRLLEA
jgi:hypothetical protein